MNKMKNIAMLLLALMTLSATAQNQEITLGDVFEHLDKVENENLIEVQKNLISQLASSEKKFKTIELIYDNSLKIESCLFQAYGSFRKYYEHIKTNEKYSKIASLIKTLEVSLDQYKEYQGKITSIAMSYIGTIDNPPSARECYNGFVDAHNKVIAYKKTARDTIFEITAIESNSSR